MAWLAIPQSPYVALGSQIPMRMLQPSKPHFCHSPPDLIVVQGDTSSALGGARAAVATGVPLAHVEAGLRTHDPSLPWPEEEYRVEIDAQSDLLFAPTKLSALNLSCERVPGQVHVTGNTGIDALLTMLPQLPAPDPPKDVLPHVLVTCHRRESWGDGLRSVATAVSELAREAIARFDVIVPPNAHVAASLRELLQSCSNVSLLGPCSHRELAQRMRNSYLVLSDSGGMQEEAPVLGVPLLVLRDKTERPEGVFSGNMRLVGTCKKTIVAETRRLLADPATHAEMSREALPYGDGSAAPRIAAIIEEWLEDRRCLSPGPSASSQPVSW